MKTLKPIAVLFLCLQTLCIHQKVAAQAKDNTVTPGTYKTIFEMLQAVPGLEVTVSNGKSGGSVTIRGAGSLMAQHGPLIVVDGAIFNGDISSINPGDVDGISVLKDAASATAYGAQGSSGVILITTKKGLRSTSQATVAAHTESAYTYFIEHKTALRVFGMSDEVIVEGPIQKQQDSTLVFIKKRKELLVPISKIKRVEMIPADQ